LLLLHFLTEFLHFSIVDSFGCNQVLQGTIEGGVERWERRCSLPLKGAKEVADIERILLSHGDELLVSVGELLRAKRAGGQVVLVETHKIRKTLSGMMEQTTIRVNIGDGQPHYFVTHCIEGRRPAEIDDELAALVRDSHFVVLALIPIWLVVGLG
jgi:hypothetical protein